MNKRLLSLVVVAIVALLIAVPVASAATDAPGRAVAEYQQMLNNCKRMLQDCVGSGHMTQEQAKACQQNLADLRSDFGSATIACPMGQ